MPSVPNLQNNPYARALDGLKLDNPVDAFFQFCKERESIRQKRERGEPGPWTTDPVFQKGRFLNIFREDDRGTKALLHFVKPVVEKGTKEELVQALFFSRWCNRDHTLNVLDPALLADPAALRSALDAVELPPWCNETAYPVEIVTWEGVQYSRLDAATSLFHKISPWLLASITSASGDVVKATKIIAQGLGMKNDFPVFMAVMDLAWFHPDLVNPASPVPTGIGAVAFLDLLEKHLGLGSHEETAKKMIELQAEYWPEAKRPFQPINIEYLSCECRKYYSYVNGTKQYEGKNVFKPGKSPMLPFDMPHIATAVSSSMIYVIAGGPCSGKTSLLAGLAARGYKTVPETAEIMINEGIKAGIPVEEQRKDPVAWQMNLLKKDFLLFDDLSKKREIVFTDTSFIETLVFGARAGIELGPGVEKWVNDVRYKAVFFLNQIEDYQTSEVRMESKKTAAQICQQVKDAYQKYGYTLVEVPSLSVVERVRFIEESINAD